MEVKTWRDFVNNESEKTYFRELINKVDQRRTEVEVYPPREDMFSCFRYCSLDNLKVVIIGQDPYHGPNQAHGMSFSVKTGVKIPPSLQNIYKELQDDLGIRPSESGYLQKWAEEGVLLMNTSWSVERGKPGSHASWGWLSFSENLLEFLNDFERPLVFILWGAHAKKVGQIITNPKHLKIESVHPSPFSAHRGFFGSRPFSQTNEFLAKNNLELIDWSLYNKK